MKNILLATTALVATAGVAAAEVSVSGFAEMGISGSDSAPTEFHTDIDVTFKMSGEADNGLAFGTAVDLDEGGSGADAHADDSEDGGVAMFISYGAAKLTLGDTDGAFDAALKEAIIGGSIIDDNEHAGYDGNSGFDATYDNQIATFQYSFEGFTGYASVEADDSGAEGDAVYGVGAKYSMELASLTIGMGLGYQAMGDDYIVGVSADTVFDNGLAAIVNYSFSEQSDVESSHVGLALGYTINEISFGANWGQYTVDDETTDSGFGLVAGYDLGGGLEAQAGYGQSLFDGDKTGETWSLGLAMSF